MLSLDVTLMPEVWYSFDALGCIDLFFPSIGCSHHPDGNDHDGSYKKLNQSICCS